MLVWSADGWSTAAFAAAFDVCQATVTNGRLALSGLQTAHLIAIACSPSPDGHDHWTVHLLAQKAVELGFVKSISPDTIHEMLKNRII